MIDTTNAIQALTSKLRRAVRTRGHVPSDEAAAKLIYLALNATLQDWKRSVREWHAVKSQFAIMFEEPFPMTEQNAAEHKIAHSLNSPFTDPDIRKAFETFDKEACDALLFIRTLIYGLAEKDQHIGHIIESLKWGQPSYDTSPKTGTPIRLGILKGKRIVQKPHVALFTHCQSSVMTQARLHYEDTLTFDGNRALLLPLSEPLPEAPLTHIIRVALRYRLDQ